MAKKTLLWLSLCLIMIGFLTVEIKGTEEKMNDRVGYELLDRFVGMFQKMAAEGSGGRDKIDTRLKELMADARKAFAEKQIDPVFFHRYNRLLMVTKLTIVEDEEGILRSLIEREVGSFVMDMKGIETEVIGRKAIGIVADAIAQATLELHIYLDTKKGRIKLMEDWNKRLEEKYKK